MTLGGPGAIRRGKAAYSTTANIEEALRRIALLEAAVNRVGAASQETEPSDKAVGMLWYQPSTTTWRVYNGSSWDIINKPKYR